MRLRRVMTAVLTFVLSTVALSHAQRPLVLVADGVSQATIIVPPGSSRLVQETAVDLAQILEKMSGATVPVAERSSGPAYLIRETAASRDGWIVPDDSDQSSQPVVEGISQVIERLLGTPPQMTQVSSGVQLLLSARPEDASLNPLAYHVRREGNALHFSGGSDQGVVNGVYALLDNLGCRWYTPDSASEYIPERRTVSVAISRFQDEPDFESMMNFGGYHDRQAGRLWLRRNRMEGFPPQFHCHNWGSIISSEEREAHPEWFALGEDGSRTNQLCTTHPHVIAMAIQRAREYFDAHPEAIMFSLSPNDNGHFCQCERCRALDEALGVTGIESSTGTFTDRLVYFCNQVAEGLQQTHPDKHLAFYAYISHTDPPRSVRPHPMLIPVICHTPWDFCAHHAIDDPACTRNRRFAEIVQGWAALSSKVYIYDYYTHYHWFGPYGLVHTIRRDLPWLRANGVVGFTNEAHGNWWTQPLNNYLPCRLAWDIEANVDAVVNDYYQHMFGPAARPITAYNQLFEDLMQNVPYDRDGERAFIQHVTPDVLARSDALITEAETIAAQAAMAPDDLRMLRLRLKKVRAGYRFMVAQAAYLQGDVDPAAVAAGEDVVSLDALLDQMETDPDLRDVIDLTLGRRMAFREGLAARPYFKIWQDANITDERRQELVQAFRAGQLQAVARGLGFIVDWHIVGLFEAPDLDGIFIAHPLEEGEVDLEGIYQGKSGPVAWRSFSSPSAYGEIDLREMFRSEDTDNAAVYLYAEVANTRNEPEAEIRIGSNDGVMLWHNGRMIHVSAVERKFTPERDRVMVTLTPGVNRFLVKVHNTAGRFKTSVRVLSRTLRPIEQEPIR